MFLKGTSNGLLKVSLESFATDIYSHGVIAKQAKNETNFNDMMTDFKSGMQIKYCQETVKYCNLIFQSLAKQGSQCENEASRIDKNWIDEIKENLRIDMKFDIK